ncbi:sensor domain-containing diguanylate cyclase [Massilia endophytica]|uniref:sensor domain-containing diguanylate cyclase n=1 Tax=Massilia endophytica TaxID=2899220 RepID=UPI001E461BA6|nr:diguanylate cyclase [Massilia endophytica]UGQ45392.1 diguanylate cyclase [Massilia endophytica]
MAGLPASTISRGIRLLGAACLLAPVLAFGETPLDSEIAAIREQVRFMPDQALHRLQKIDSEARSAPPAAYGEFLVQMASAWRGIHDNEKSLQAAEQLIAFGKAHKDNALLAKGMLAKAYTLSAMSELKASHAVAFEAEKIANTTNDMPLRVQATITAGQSFAEQGNFPSALPKLQLAVDLARPITEDLTPLAMALNALVLVYVQLKEYDKGWEVQAESMEVAHKLNSPGRLAIALSTEYGLAIDTQQDERAMRALLRGLEVVRKLGARRMEATTLVNLSDIYLKQRDYASALRFGNESLQAALKMNDTRTEATARINIGQAYLGMGRVAEGKKSFEAGLAVYEKLNDKPELQIILTEYGDALERAGDYAAAVSAYHRERRLSNELFEKARQKAVLELQEKYDAEKKQRQIESLSHENLAKSAELDNRRLQQRVWWLLALVFALASVIVGLLYRKVRQANAQLEVKNLELKQQSSLDPLTSLYNRRHFQEYMRAHNHHERRGAGSDEEMVGALFLLDVDHFKHVNDTHGHAAGDAVLKMIAEQLRVALRETDMIVRWGGEEFLAFLPSVPRSSLEEVARRILYSISTQPLDYQGTAIPVNVSVGFAPFPLMPGNTPLPWERAVNLVDMALYLAKAHGRNRAYGVRGFSNFHSTTMEHIEQDLERAWREGFVDLSVVLGGAPGVPPPSASNVVPLNVQRKTSS